jgi:hypothetical protein
MVFVRARQYADGVCAQYGKSFSAHRTYPISLQWIVAAGDTIEDFVQDMRRRAKQCALVCVQVPWYSRSLSLLDPSAQALVATGYQAPTSQLPSFVVPLRLPLSVRAYDLMSAAEWELNSEPGPGAPPPRNAFLVIFEEALVARFGFFADTAASGRALRQHKRVAAFRSLDDGRRDVVPLSPDQRVSATPRGDGSGSGGGGTSIGRDVHVRRRWEGSLVESVSANMNWFKQYVHMSRVALVRIEAMGAAWVPWLAPAGSPLLHAATALLNALSEFCCALSTATELCDEILGRAFVEIALREGAATVQLVPPHDGGAPAVMSSTARA